MKKVLAVVVFALGSVVFGAEPVFASECKEGTGGVSIAPVSDELSFKAGDIHDASVKIKNMNAETAADLRVYAAPYSVGDNGKDFTTEKSLTQISHWIKFLDGDEYVDEVNLTIEACSEKEISYRITIPDSVPNGGQYAVIFVEGAASGVSGGIRAVSRAGMLVYGRALDGETIESSELSEPQIFNEQNDTLKGRSGEPIEHAVIYASAMTKNTGNVDIAASGELKVENFFGQELYHNTSTISVLPEATEEIREIWEDTPFMGIFRATYTVTATGADAVSVTKMFIICPLPVLITMAVLLIIVMIGVIRHIKKRHIRKARYGF